MSKPQCARRELHAKGQSFLIRINFRQNNCWQGTIQWLEGQKVLSFRSLLEMLLLINEALEKTSTAEDKPETRTWEQPSTIACKQLEGKQ